MTLDRWKGIILPTGKLADLDAFEKAHLHHRCIAPPCKHWWIDPTTGEDLRKNALIVPTKLLLTRQRDLRGAWKATARTRWTTSCHSSHAFETEMADAIIRIGDLAAQLSANVGAAAKSKLLYNLTRPDHKAENRVKKGGKKY